MYADYHLHCEYSDDYNEPMENQIQEAITLGLDEMCFTDHVDYGIKRDWDDPEGIIIRHAIEHGKEVDLVLANVNYPKYFEALNMYQKGKTQKQYNDEYYKEIYQTMQIFHHYSCLAHLDLLARYDENGIYPFENEKDIIAEILKYAIRDGKGIEINTSSWKYGLKDTQPSRAILKLYKDLGGKIITVGSDAHETKYLASHIKDAYAILKNEIGINEICTFDHMQPIFHKI